MNLATGSTNFQKAADILRISYEFYAAFIIYRFELNIMNLATGSTNSQKAADILKISYELNTAFITL